MGSRHALTLFTSLALSQLVVAPATGQPEDPLEAQYHTLEREWKKKRPSKTKHSVKIIEERDEVAGLNTWKTTKKKVTRSLHRVNFNRRSAGKIFPGSLLYVEPLSKFELEQVAHLKGREVKFSLTDVRVAKGNLPSASHDGSYSSFQEAMTKVRQGIKATAPRIEMRTIVSTSFQSALIEAGFSVNGWGVEFSGTLGDYKKGMQSCALLVLEQRYYSAVADAPGLGGMIPYSLVKVNGPRLVLREFAGKSEPVYVKKVEYGRRVLFAFRSRASVEELKAALAFSTKGFSIEAAAEAKAAWERASSGMEFAASVCGGADIPIKVTAKVEDFVASVNEFLKDTGGWGMTTVPVPLSFEVEYCQDRKSYALVEEVEFAEGRITNTLGVHNVPLAVDLKPPATLLVAGQGTMGYPIVKVTFHYEYSISKDKKAVHLKVRFTVIGLDGKGKHHPGWSQHQLYQEFLVYRHNGEGEIQSVRLNGSDKTTDTLSENIAAPHHSLMGFTPKRAFGLKKIQIHYDLNGTNSDHTCTRMKATAEFAVTVATKKS